jgi:aryl-alcohol dehydrogenase-like predicted oxidoreductase
MIPKAIFGRTGHLSSRVIFGSWALSSANQKEADQVLKLLLEYGINHIDTAQMYGNAKKLIGSWMKTHRQDFFLATKTRKRTHKGATADLYQSLRLLGVDYIDLWQMHSLTNPSGWESAMGTQGTLEVFINAREKGLVRFLGVTGHGSKAPVMHQRSLARFDFDSVLLPYSYHQMQDQRYAADFEALMTTCRERNVAVQTIKSVARRPWLDQSKSYNTYFYEPLATQDAIEKSVHWVLSFPDCFLITAGDMKILPMILQAADRFTVRPSDAEMNALVSEYELQPIFSY